MNQDIRGTGRTVLSDGDHSTDKKDSGRISGKNEPPNGVQSSEIAVLMVRIGRFLLPVQGLSLIHI